jgi:hypothetical protein
MSENLPADPPRSGSVLGRVLRYGFLVLVAGLAVYWVYTRREEVGSALRRVNAWSVVGALVLASAGAWSGVPAWRELLSGLGSRLGLRDAQRVFLMGQLGKYIPGGVWTVLAQASMAHELKVPRGRSGTASLMAILLAIVTAFGLGAVLLLISGRDVLGRYGWALLLVVPVLALLQPDVMVMVGRLASRVTGRNVQLERIPERTLLSAAAWLSAGQVVNGLQILLLAGPVAGDYPPVLLTIGLFAFASAAGLLVPIAPAGVGIREVILVFGLVGFMDKGSALLVVLMSRLVVTIADFGLAAMGAAIGRRRGPVAGSSPLQPP